LDAGQEGLVARLTTISQEISTAKHVKNGTVIITNAGFIRVNDIYFGASVFTKPKIGRR